MSTFVSNRDGGKTNEEGHYRFHVKVWSGNVQNGLNVTQNSPLGMSVLVAAGDLKIDYTTYGYTAWNDAAAAVTITTANPSNPRIDRIVAYIDRGMTPTTVNSNNPGMLKFAAVAGTPAGSPTRPNDATVQSAIGAGNPFCDLADVLVGTGVTQITNANITDKRVFIGLPTGFVTYAQTDGKIWWEEIGRTTLAGAGDTITVSSLSARKYLHIRLMTIATGGTTSVAIQFNGDTGTNYARQSFIDGSAPASVGNQNNLQLDGGSTAENKFFTIDLINIANQEKIGTSYGTESGGAGAGLAPDETRQNIKWSNTAAQISSITVTNNAGAGDYAIGSEVVVLGHN